MKLLLFILLTVSYSIPNWDYLLFVQVWPGSWITNQNSNFNNTYFTIHGIWPQYYNNTWPQFCDKEQFNFTAIQNIRKYLEIYWTNFEKPEELWVHEFKKHATCAENDPLLATEYQFFSTGLALRNRYDLYNILKNNSIVPSNVVKYSPLKLSKIISKSLNNTVVVICDSNDILNEVRICLNKNLEQFDCPTLEMKEQCKQKYILYNIIQ